MQIHWFSRRFSRFFLSLCSQMISVKKWSSGIVIYLLFRCEQLKQVSLELASFWVYHLKWSEHVSVIFTGIPLELKRCKSPLRSWIRDLPRESTGSTQEPTVRRSRIHDLTGLLHLFDSKGIPVKITDTCMWNPLWIAPTGYNQNPRKFYWKHHLEPGLHTLKPTWFS